MTELVCRDLDAALAEWRGKGFRLDSLYPADEPHTAILSREGVEVRLTTRPGEGALSDVLPPFRPQFIVTRDGPAAAGRAGMRYRDLIPGRLGGRYVASHITIPGGGPVEDWVHYHGVAFQMIHVVKGWVRVVYEDQGEPFVAHAGDLILQPPFIRHRVLESSAGLEVVEIGCPAVHKTFTDHEMVLPNGLNPQRRFSGQQFLHQAAGTGRWEPFSGGEAQPTAMAQASGGLAEVRTIRAAGGQPLRFGPHRGELVFGFVLAGSARLERGDGLSLQAGDAIVIPPSEAWALVQPSEDFRLLHVTTSGMPASIPAESA